MDYGLLNTGTSSMAAAHHRFTEMQFNGKAKQSGAKPGSKPRAKQGRVKKEVRADSTDDESEEDVPNIFDVS